MLVAFWIVVPILTYLFAAGLFASKFQRAVIKRCNHCRIEDGIWVHSAGRYDSKKYSTSIHNGSPWLAVIWPIVFPIMIGQFAADSKPKKSRAERKIVSDKQRRANEIEEQRHQVEIAKLRARENELLDQHLKLNEIRGRVQDQ